MAKKKICFVISPIGEYESGYKSNLAILTGMGIISNQLTTGARNRGGG